MCSPIMRCVGMGSWLITSLVSLNIGLSALLGWNFFATNFMMTTMAGLKMPLDFIIGFAGLWSLYLMIMALTSKCCPSCGSCKQ